MRAQADAGANIAFIKYWGVRDEALNLPLNDSISMTLDAARTTTAVEFSPRLADDVLTINDKPASEAALRRVSRHLDLVRERAGVTWRARVRSRNTFPMGAGVASSAAAFAALTAAAAAALRLELDGAELSRLARRGSGSAARSVYGGYVWWHAGTDDTSSFAELLAPPEHWDVRDVVAVVATAEKAVSSAEGHRLAHTSPFLRARLAQTQRLLPCVREAVLRRELALLGPCIEADALAMHFVMMSSRPPLFYWAPETLALIKAVHLWREAGLAVYFTIDAGPNVHLICEAADVEQVIARVQALEYVREIIVAGPGPGIVLQEPA
ncbi:MAG: diphosphomevalonate decarboxylase [Ardenticatenia bacterium]|nr:diphosphomevalonate decarboxylase [Ardenticatenia bacterium]